MKERNYQQLNSTLFRFPKLLFSSVYFAITCFSVTPYELGRQNQIALTFSCYQRKKIVYVKYSTPLHSQKLRFLFSVFRDRMLFGDPIRVGTAQKYSLNIRHCPAIRGRKLSTRNASRVTDRQTESRFKSNKLTFSGGLVGYFIIRKFWAGLCSWSPGNLNLY